MNILMVTPHAPYPPNSGSRTRQWQLLNFFAQRHSVSVIYFVADDEPARYEALSSICQQDVAVRFPETPSPADHALGAGAPWLVSRYGTAAMSRALDEIKAHNFDLVLLEYIYMTPYRALLPPSTILHEHNIESEIYKQYAQQCHASESTSDPQRERRFWNATWLSLANHENQTWPQFPLRITVSEHDKREMDRRCPVGETIVVENGVDARHYTPLPANNSRTVLFMGTLNYFPNVDAAFYLVKTIMPHVWQIDPTIRLCIAGRDPLPTLIGLSVDPRIEVIANPPDMREVAAGAGASVVPLRMGSGTRLKILDSFALGLPVVSTHRGSEGLCVQDGDHLLIRDDPKEFAHAIVQVVSDSELKTRLVAHGHALVEQRYDWNRIFEPLEQEVVAFASNVSA